MTMYPKSGGLNNSNSFSRGSRGQTPEPSSQQGRGPSEGAGEESAPGLSLSSWGCQQPLVFLGLWRRHSVSAPISLGMWPAPAGCLSVSTGHFPPSEDHSCFV